MVKINTINQAKEIFESKAGIARAIGVSKQAISQWPNKLDQGKKDRLLGAAIRLNLIDVTFNG